MKINPPNTDELSLVDLTKYNKILMRRGNDWINYGFECKKCLSTLKKLGRINSHPEFCKGRPLNPSQRGE